MIYNKLIGTGVALITPFNEDFSIDYNSFEKLISYNINSGIDYLVINGTTGESPNVSVDERNEIISFVSKINNNRLPIILGIGGNNTVKVVEEINNTELDNISAILSVSPYYNKPTQQGIYEHYKYIASNCLLPILIYNVPGRTSQNITPTTILRLADDFDNIVGVKEASGDFNQYLELIKNKPDNFLIISGDDDLAMEVVQSGGHGVISVIAQAFPKIFSDSIKLALDKKKSINKLNKIISLIFEENNPAGIKYVLSKKHLCKNILRLPIVSVTDSLKLKIDLELDNI